MKLIINFCPIFCNTFFYTSRHTLYQRLQKLKSFESQIFRILRFHSLINPESIFSNESFIICHKFSIGFRSGKQGGPSKAPIPWLLSHYFVFAVWEVTSSCWRTYPTRYITAILGSRLAAKILLNLQIKD
jgi:hypothetical protein